METAKHPLQVWIDGNKSSVGELASKVGCSVPHIRNIIAGRRGASLKQAQQFSEATNLSMDVFIRTGDREAAE